MAVPVPDGDGCQPGLHHDPVRPGTVQFGQRALVGGAVLQGETVPEGSEALLLVTGEDAVGHRLGDALPEAFLESAFDVLAGGVGALGDGRWPMAERHCRRAASLKVWSVVAWATRETISWPPGYGGHGTDCALQLENLRPVASFGRCPRGNYPSIMAVLFS